jgi:hypothetical protein
MTDSERQRRLTELLNEVAGADLRIDAPRGMEERVLRHWDADARVGPVRIRWESRTRGWLVPGAGALAAAMLLLVVVHRSARGPIAVRMPVAPPEVGVLPRAVESPTAAAAFPAGVSRPVAIARTGREGDPRRVDTPGEIVSFMPLSPDARQDLTGSFQVARVLLPREALADLGVVLDANRMGEPIQADVVFGEDGLARAIRLADQDAGRSR